MKSTDFDKLWQSGEVWRLAALSADAHELALRIGIGRDSLEKNLGRLRREGQHVPHLTSLLLQAKRLGRTNLKQDLSFEVNASSQVDEWDEPTRETPIIQEVDSSQTVSDSADVGVPFQQHTPPGFHVKGLSTLYDGDGNPRAQWVKANRDAEDRWNALVEAIKTIAEPFRGAAEPANLNGAPDDDLLAVYPFGDPHFGLYSWAQETGEAFDLDVAERVTFGAIDHLVRLAPNARRALILSVGDTLHADGFENRTQSGHALDVDTRYPKVLRVAVRSYRRCIDRALEKHEHVTVWMIPGNHDPVSSVAIALALQQFYEREPRVFIEASPSKFMWYRFGDNLIGGTHGDKAKPARMASVMACDRAKDWGETTCRVMYSGHLHFDRTEEFPGVIVETLRTLAAKDAWHSAMGYRSGRDAKCDVYHRKFGRISRHVVNVTQLLEAA